MADAAVTFLLENLALLVKHQFDLITGAKGELELLKQDLESLKAFLRDAARIRNKPEGFRDIESQIRDAVYDAEDTIDSCMTNVIAAAEAKQHSFGKLFGRRSKTKHLSLAQEVKSLRDGKVIQMVNTAKQFAATTAMAKGSRSTTDDESPSNSEMFQIMREENIVGFDDKEETIIGYLLEPEEELDVISIIGMPGLGKSTLAWKIFKNARVEGAFPNRIWVYVTQTPNIKSVFLKILENFTSDDMSGLSDHKLIDTLQFYLKERKFLLVLDDVWTTKAWEDIKKVLSSTHNRSRVIITSRENSVGEAASKSRAPYDLPPLDDDQSWDLLQYEVYGKLGMCPDDLETTGRIIANNCHGLPLSLVVIGGILVEQNAKNKEPSLQKEAWLKVSSDVGEFLRNEKKQQVSDIVGLSYDRLPDDLRDCFLYLAVFPEDYEISVWKLIRMWIAEGFIQGRNLEETAEDNLKELISRNLVMVGQRNSKGEVKTCRVHDVVLAFCTSKVLQEQQNFFRELKFLNGNFDPPLSGINRHRRLCIHSDLENFLAHPERKNAARIRSLICFYKRNTKLPTKYAPIMVDGFDMLRVLESESIRLDQIPEGIPKLFHLRYITLSVDTLEILSEKFANLWNIQTLVICTAKDSLIIKANIWKMIQLRHLRTKAVITQLGTPGDVGVGCNNLQTLSRISPEICTSDVFKKAPNLKSLGIQGNLASLFNTKSLEMLNQLEKLKLVDTSEENSESKKSMQFPELRNWFPRGLKMLTIVATNLDWKHMSTLSRIETLQVLKLKSDAFTGTSWEAIGGGFKALHFLHIEDSKLYIWKASNDSFPILRSLVLNKCTKLKEIPNGVTRRLEKLSIEELSQSAVKSAKSIEEEKKKLNPGREGAGFKLITGSGCA